MIEVVFKKPDGTSVTVEARPKETILQVAQRHDIDIDGRCDGALSCGACQVIVHPDWIDLLPPPSEDEEDLLGMACNRKVRLACQIEMTDELSGIVVSLMGKTCCGCSCC